jgi:hypothetical protein
VTFLITFDLKLSPQVEQILCHAKDKEKIKEDKFKVKP